MNKIGRNDPCSCGSGKKYKKCCEMPPKSKKFNAEVIRSVPDQAVGMSKVASLFFRGAAPVKSAESPTSPEVPAQVSQES